MTAPLAVNTSSPPIGSKEPAKEAFKPSFAQILGKILVDEVKETNVEGTRFRKEGELAIGLTASDEKNGEAFMEKHVIVLKFSSYRPTLEDIRDSIHRTWGILGDFSLGLLDQRHVLVRLQSEAEAKKVLAMDSFLIRGVRFKAFRWHDGFSLKADPISVPLWVELPNLPLHLFHPPLLKAIVNSFGVFLRMDDHTRCLSRPSYARVCVEMTLAEKLPSRIWIDKSNNRGFWQMIEYPGFKYCDYCSLLGHQEDYCRKKLGHKGNVRTPNLVKEEKTEKQKVEAKVLKQQYVPVVKKNKISTPEAGTSGVKNDQGEEIQEDVSAERPMVKDSGNVMLSNKFESLTEAIVEDESNLMNHQLPCKAKDPVSDMIEPETTEEGLLEAGYTAVEIAKAIQKQGETISGLASSQPERVLPITEFASSEQVASPIVGLVNRTSNAIDDDPKKLIPRKNANDDQAFMQDCDNASGSSSRPQQRAYEYVHQLELGRAQGVSTKAVGGDVGISSPGKKTSSGNASLQINAMIPSSNSGPTKEDAVAEDDHVDSGFVYGSGSGAHVGAQTRVQSGDKVHDRKVGFPADAGIVQDDETLVDAIVLEAPNIKHINYLVHNANSETEMETDTDISDTISSEEEDLDEYTIRSRVVSGLKTDQIRISKRFHATDFRDIKVYPRRSSRMKESNSKYRH